MSNQQRKTNAISMALPFMVLALFFSIMIFQKYRASSDAPEKITQQRSEGFRFVALFFSRDGEHLARETRELDLCSDENSCLRSTLEELIHGPLGELDETIPEGVVVDSATINGSVATVSFNRLFMDGLQSGSMAEMLVVYSVVNTVAANFSQVKFVKINVEGNNQIILKHLDLSAPLAPDFLLEQPVSEGVPDKTGQHEHSTGTGVLK